MGNTDRCECGGWGQEHGDHYPGCKYFVRDFGTPRNPGGTGCSSWFLYSFLVVIGVVALIVALTGCGGSSPAPASVAPVPATTTTTAQNEVAKATEEYEQSLVQVHVTKVRSFAVTEWDAPALSNATDAQIMADADAICRDKVPVQGLIRVTQAWNLSEEAANAYVKVTRDGRCPNR